jgi:hypothetical protein
MTLLEDFIALQFNECCDNVHRQTLTERERKRVRERERERESYELRQVIHR